MSDVIGDELARLRARAYGADADIHRDPRALARLNELEAQQRAPVGAGAVVAEDVPTHSVDPPPSPQIPQSEPPTHPRSSGRRLLVGVAAASAALAVAVTIPATVWVASLQDRPFATLAHVDAALPTVFFSPESRAQRYEDFYGIRVSVGSFHARETECILLELDPRPDAEVDPGPTVAHCAEGGFPASVDVAVADIESYLAPEGRAALDQVSALRFVAADDVVRVFAGRIAPSERDNTDDD